MIDIHIHSNFSPDGFATIEQYVVKGIEKGYSMLGISEHIDVDFLVRGYSSMPQTDIDGYREEILRLNEKYQGKFKLLFGAEFGFDEGAEEKYAEIAQKYDFDYIINSVHLVDGEDCWHAPYYENKTKKEAYGKYLNAVLRSLDAKYPYNVVGHVGYVSRKATYFDKKIYLSEFGQILDEIYKKIIAKEKTLEINTSTRGIGNLIPDEDMLRRYFAIGGRKISFGTDSHDVDRIGEKHGLARGVLEQANIDKTIHFEKGIEIYDNLLQL